MSDIRSFLDNLEASEQARQLAARRRREDEKIEELVELARAHNEGRTTHRSIAAQVDIERATAWRALKLLTEVFDWETGVKTTNGDEVGQEWATERIQAAKKTDRQRMNDGSR